MGKIIWILAIVLILALGVSSYLLFFQTKDECSNYSQQGFSTKDDCYERVVNYGYVQYAQEGQYNKINFEYCEKIINQDNKDRCYSFMAYLKQDKASKLVFCNKIVNSSIKDACISAHNQ